MVGGLPRTFDTLRDGDYEVDIMRIASAMPYKPTERRFHYEGELISKYDYSLFKSNRGKMNNFVIPLEIIFRK